MKAFLSCAEMPPFLIKVNDRGQDWPSFLGFDKDSITIHSMFVLCMLHGELLKGTQRTKRTH